MTAIPTMLFAALWPGPAAAFALGLAIGALTGLPRDRPGLAVAAGLVLALAVLSALAVLGHEPGHVALWIEAAALLLALYLAGCVVGGLGRLVVLRPAADQGTSCEGGPVRSKATHPYARPIGSRDAGIEEPDP